MKNYMNLNMTPDSQFAVLGLGKFGRAIVKELVSHNRHVWCCDVDEEVVQTMSTCVEHVVQADASNDDFLDKIGIGNFDVVIVAFSANFEDSVLTTMKLKEKNVPFVIVKAGDERRKKVLESVGADYAILPEVIMGERVAHSLIYNDPLSHIHESEHFDIIEMHPKQNWIGKDLSTLQLTKKENINVLGIIRDDNLVNRITPQTVLLENDILVVIKTLTDK